MQARFALFPGIFLCMLTISNCYTVPRGARSTGRYLLEDSATDLATDMVGNGTVWDLYTISAERLYLGNVQTATMKAATEEDCAQMCLETQPCWFWSWCPEDAAGCTGVSFGVLEATDVLAPFSCLLTSSDPATASYVVASGPSVTWVGGKLRSPLLTGSDPFEDPIEEIPPPPEGRPNTMFMGAAVVGGTMLTTESPGACALRCRNMLLCEMWAWCPADTPMGCTLQAFGDYVSEGILGRVKPGTCMGSIFSGKTMNAALVMTGDDVMWSAGVLDTPAPPNPSPSPSPSPEPASPSPSPSSSPSPAPSPSPTPSPSPSPSPEPSPTPSPPLPSDPCAGVTCEAPSPCLQDPGSCREGTCWWFPQPLGTPCGDGNLCDRGGNCVDASLIPDDPCDGLTCETDSPCLISPGTCQEGQCWWFPKQHGTPCGDGGVCDVTGECRASGEVPKPDLDPGCKPEDCVAAPNACLLAPGSCVRDTCMWYPAEAGTACGDGKTCDGAGACA